MANLIAGELSDLPGAIERTALSPFEHICPDGMQTSIPQGERMREARRFTRSIVALGTIGRSF